MRSISALAGITIYVTWNSLIINKNFGKNNNFKNFLTTFFSILEVN